MTMLRPSLLSSMRIFAPPKYMTPVEFEPSEPLCILRLALNCIGCAPTPCTEIAASTTAAPDHFIPDAMFECLG